MSRAERARAAWSSLPHPVRWIGAAAVGSALVLVGLVLMVLPGPGIPVLLLGLVVLATEFAWAQRTLNLVRQQSTAALSTVTKRFSRRETTS